MLTTFEWHNLNEHVLFVYIVKQKQAKHFANFIKKRGFSKFVKNQILLEANCFKIRSSINL